MNRTRESAITNPYASLHLSSTIISLAIPRAILILEMVDVGVVSSPRGSRQHSMLVQYA